MVRRNGKSDVDSAELDVEHELPAAEGAGAQEDPTAAGVAPPAARESEFDKLNINNQYISKIFILYLSSNEKLSFLMVN